MQSRRPKNVVQNIKALRTFNEATVETTAEAMKVSKPTYYVRIREPETITIESLEGVAELFGVEPEWLYMPPDEFIRHLVDVGYVAPLFGATSRYAQMVFDLALCRAA